MARSENPFTQSFWLGTVDPRPFALFRIALGLSVLHDLVDYTRDLRAFITDDGIVPRGAVHDWRTWSVFDLVGSVPAVWAVFVLGVVAVVAFTVGYRTRIATIASWLFLLSLHHRNYYVTDGGDELTHILFFYGMFTDLGAAYGVDATRRATRVTDIPAFGPRLLQLHVAFLYFVAARLKFRAGWLHNDGIFAALQLDGFVRPPGAWMLASPAFCRIATKLILAMEFLFPFTAFAPWSPRRTRAVAIALGLAIQTGILVTMRVGIFTEVMLAVVLLWVQPEWIDRAEAFVRARWSRSPDERPVASIPAPRGAHALYGLLALQFVLAQWDAFAGGRLPLPKWIHNERDLISIVQPAGLFNVNYDIPRWSAPGRLADGREVDVLAVAAPDAQPRGSGIRFSRWNKFTFKDRDYPYLFPELTTYLCRTFDERSPGARLVSFTLVKDLTPRRDDDGAPPLPSTRHVLWEGTCGP
jgi:Vitamin K-dependent gamma-carboxylase